jgi:uncharacterized protein (DUF1697 family)
MREEVFIVLFRGVGPDTKLPTAPLRAALGNAGFRNVATYIATGNVVLTSELAPGEVRARIAAIVKKAFGFEKEVLIRTGREWARVIRDNPFPEGADNPKALHAFILGEKPSNAAIDLLAAKAAESERVAVKGKTLYYLAPDGFGTAKLPALIERTLKIAMTARNWNTVVRLGDMARETAAAIRPKRE